ncbi:hypothetical protein BJV78DRAFT_613392 [Lactifluus subvellereus]|nr:hypothetical protein BJV78DRAFT_613392 [Lactifluus subvellereus]
MVNASVHFTTHICKYFFRRHLHHQPLSLPRSWLYARADFDWEHSHVISKAASICKNPNVIDDRGSFRPCSRGGQISVLFTSHRHGVLTSQSHLRPLRIGHVLSSTVYPFAIRWYHPRNNYQRSRRVPFSGKSDPMTWQDAALASQAQHVQVICTAATTARDVLT